MSRKPRQRPQAGSRHQPGAPSTARPEWRWLAALAVLAFSAGGAWLLLGRSSGFEPQKTSDQNVLLITIDTLRADALGFAGGRAATPNLDRLAALGVRFDSAHAHAVVTLPSHASILTGLYPFQHGIHDNAGFRLAPSVPTLAARLRDKGFATGAFIGSFSLDSRFGLARAFDVYDEQYGKSNTASGFRMAERRADAVVRAATGWIGAQNGRWFAWVHVFDPHGPYEPPAPFDMQYRNSPYHGEVAFTDAALGPLLDAARDDSGRPTLVVVTSDHGEGLGEHGEATHGLFAYEPTLRIPLVLAQVTRETPAWNAEGPSGGGIVSPLAARHVDLVPTVLDVLELGADTTLPGRSLFDPEGTRLPRPSYFEALSSMLNRGWAPLTGVLAGGEKYIDLPIPELYDLPSDPAEKKNLAETAAERVRALAARLTAFNASPQSARKREDAQALARLQALGYVSGQAAPKARYTEEDDPKRRVALEQLMHEAVELYERKRPLQAMEAYQRVIASRPGMEMAYTQLAMLQWELGQPARAIATLKDAMKAGGTSGPLQATLGIYLAESGAWAEAIPLLEHATAGDDVEVDALNALGIAYGRADRPADAKRAFERLLTLDASNTMALENLGTIAVSEGRLEDGRRWFRAALDKDPASPQAHNGLGAIELRSGNRKRAIEHWRQAVEADAANFDALYNLGTELVNDGRAPEARPFLERFVQMAPPAFYGADIARVRSILARPPSQFGKSVRD